MMTQAKHSQAVMYLNAAGLDIGSRDIWAAIDPEREVETVRCFGTFTPDLERLATWLIECGVETVAMEATGVYWIPVFELLEACGLQVYLVNARHLKRVPGRKTDIQDCQSPKGRRSALAPKATQPGATDWLLPA
jgi:transposase